VVSLHAFVRRFSHDATDDQDSITGQCSITFDSLASAVFSIPSLFRQFEKRAKLTTLSIQINHKLLIISELQSYRVTEQLCLLHSKSSFLTDF